MRKLTAMLLVLILAAALAVPASAAGSPADNITILYTNDIHTYIDKTIGYSELAALKDSYNGNALLVDAGDHIQGTAYGSMDQGKTVIDLMNAAGYDVATLGNHEFDYGQSGRIQVTDVWAAFPYVSCNFYHESGGVRGANVLDSYKVFTVGGLKIAFIGITTPESFTKTTPAYFQDASGNYIYGISGGTDGAALYADVQAAIYAASAEADIVIALGHLGDDPSSHPWTSEDVIANTSGLDAFIDGHSHNTVESKPVLDKDGNTVLLTQTGQYFDAVGELTISPDSSSISSRLITQLPETLVPDTAVKAIEDAWISEIEASLGQKVGTAAITLDNYDANGNRLVRTQETNSGSFAADALYYLFDNMGLDVDVAIMNGGGVRNTAITGDLTYQTCKQIHTFGNVACLQTVTGQQLLDALEWGARQAPDVQVGGFLQVAGITYEVDATIQSTVQQDDKGVWTGGPTGEYRVKNVKVFNKETGEYDALDLTASYSLAGYNYTLRDLGDGFAMFRGAVNVLDYVMEDYMVLANYIQGFENAAVDAVNSPLNTKYPGLQIDYSRSNRIKITTTPTVWDGKITIGGLTNDIWFTKYGNVYTDCTSENFVNTLGLTWGDTVTVQFLDQALTVPVVPTYSYVNSGEPAIILRQTETGQPTGYISLAINMGNFAQTYGLAVKKTDNDGTWYWEAAEGVGYPVEVTFTLAEKEGYLTQYLLAETNRTNSREDYVNLTDAEFANFRELTTGNLVPKTLYRTSSPINPELGRNAFADAALKAAGVTVIMNLADNETAAKAYPGFDSSYYSGQKVIYLNLGVDFASEDFKSGLARGLRFFAENKGIYAVHCTEGKDRAGFVSALLECLTGATYEEVVTDYMQTYINYYSIEKGSAKYEAIAQNNIVRTLQSAFGINDLTTADLASEAAEYIRSLGLTDAEISQLKTNLTVPKAATPPTGDAGIAGYAVLCIFSAAGIALVQKKRRNVR